MIANPLQGLGRLSVEMQETNRADVLRLRPVRNEDKMKSVKALTALASAVALLASVTIARAETCCEKAKAAGKECTHNCCVKAAKAGKTCEKCNPKKEAGK